MRVALQEEVSDLPEYSPDEFGEALDADVDAPEELVVPPKSRALVDDIVVQVAEDDGAKVPESGEVRGLILAGQQVAGGDVPRVQGLHLRRRRIGRCVVSNRRMPIRSRCLRACLSSVWIPSAEWEA